MASIARASSRSALRSASITSSTRSTMHDIPLAFPRHASRQQFRRGYASGRISQAESSKSLYWGLGLALTGGVGFVAYSQTKNPRATPIKQDLANSQRSDKKDNQDDGQKNDEWMPKQEDYQKVYDAIAEKFVEEDEYDDGSYGPVVLRLAWHASGTYDAETGTGGSNGATMRFDPEGDHGANAGLKNARDFLAPLKDRFPWISYSDLWTLAGVCAIQEMQGPTVPWRPGRQDRDIGFCTPDGRLPDGAKGPDHLRAIFGRMGFDDREIVALSGAHALGRCHTDRSGFEGPWTFSPTTLTNDFFKFLLETEWHWRQWDGPRQYQDKETKSLMMLPTDMALVQDDMFKPHVERYAKDEAVFFKEFSDAVCKLFELGVPFTVGEDARMELKRSE